MRISIGFSAGGTLFQTVRPLVIPVIKIAAAFADYGDGRHYFFHAPIIIHRLEIRNGTAAAPPQKSLLREKEAMGLSNLRAKELW